MNYTFFASPLSLDNAATLASAVLFLGAARERILLHKSHRSLAINPLSILEQSVLRFFSQSQYNPCFIFCYILDKPMNALFASFLINLISKTCCIFLSLSYMIYCFFCSVSIWGQSQSPSYKFTSRSNSHLDWTILNVFEKWWTPINEHL